MEILNSILENSGYTVVTAFILGLMTAISPCPLAMNLSAIGFISRDISNRNKVFLSGLVYTAGRALSYTMIGVVLFLGASKFDITRFFQGWGEKIVGPALIIIGLFMLDVIRIPSRGFNFADRMERLKGGLWTSLLLGVVFALAFCPYSGVLYFGMLIPITVASPSGLFLPVIFALATGLPVIIFAWLLAYAVGNVGKAYNTLRSFELWFRRIVAVLFIIVGIYYVIIYFI
ncbi:MAG TPA: aromatic aminobenezylarsenical efflux permease ArsG family transporter [Lentimicrobium sp.]|nr:aromatic aminobenezylarsenical efflux permease ArsG family transporter [Lentimicrobium sp.]